MSDAREAAGNPDRRRAIPSAAREDRWTAPDGHAVRRIDWPAPDGRVRGAILFLGGRGDFYEKYLEAFADWRDRGWQVTALDWRGQAGSGRLGSDAVTGHIGDFAQWTHDLAGFWRAWAAEVPVPHVIVAHSMGAHLALRGSAEGLIAPDALVLVAPMLGIGRLPPVVMHTVARAMVRLGDPRRPAWRWSEKPGEPPASRGALLTHDADRYADELWWRGERPELVMGPGSWGWVERAYASMRALSAPGLLEKVTLPVLILATSADRLVAYPAIAAAARRLPNAELVTFGREASHEILREADPVRDRALAAIDRFLDETVPAR
ncbi:alpha/beta hydrolase [Tsuneonella sp. YG55]|uniref:Alpha/beta hydrolase n=1 Tax=Tsuneonella litorea TaxID=2976475 RepID=A0A9X2W2D6_9SPHN|nr:alpha/beta hydrolase [Tsuneonella litorea]MCT2559685.1 alpha/beta hydrolase [Tsuneonella litorea]